MRGTFDDHLARARGPTMVGGQRQSHPTADAVRGPTILVVEDQALVRFMIADELRNAGFTIIEASNADEALDVLRHNNANAQVLFSDVRMPGTIDGAELARIVRSDFPHLRVVLTSGIVESIDGTEHDGFFPKPYEPAQLVRHLKALLRERTALGS